jgi:MacB-like periplasmic core domain
MQSAGTLPFHQDARGEMRKRFKGSIGQRVRFLVISLTCSILASAPSADAQTTCDAAMPGVHNPSEVSVFVTGYSSRTGDFTLSSVSHLNYNEISTRPITAVFAGFRLMDGRVARPGQTERTVRVQVTTAAYFDVLGVRPQMGRMFLPDEDRPEDTPAVAVISDQLWLSMFYLDPGTVGQKMTVNGRRVTIVGIAPQGFHGVQQPSEETLWLPGALLPDANDRRSEGYSHFVVRLGDDTTWRQAVRDFARLPPLLAKLFPAENQKFKNVSFYDLGPITCLSH